MSQRRLTIGALAVLALLAFPREGRASFWDYIWEMSGPQMFQVTSTELFGPISKRTGKVLAFRVNDISLKEPRIMRSQCAKEVQGGPERKQELIKLVVTDTDCAPSFWWFLTATGYTSTGKNADETEYTFGQNSMIAIEPMIAYRTGGSKPFMFYIGAGASFDVLFIPNVAPYKKIGLKFRPLGVIISEHIDLGFNLRVYPHGFLPDEFGHGERKENIDRPAESTWGVSVGVAW